MNSLYDALYSALVDIAQAADKPDAKLLEDQLHKLKDVFCNLPSYAGQTVNDEKLLRDVLEAVATYGGITTSLKDERDHEAWLSSERADISWNYWKRYTLYLKKQEKFPPAVISSIDKSTDTILSLMESPKRQGDWDRRGMVVGNIQSGKTSNYVGLICKAVDAGYKVIIVLAGLNNDLRSQTQKRIDKGFLGRDTSKSRNHDRRTTIFGAGRFSSRGLQPVTAVTSSEANGDYRKSVHSTVTITPGGDPVIAVVKKNVTPLKNLFDWFANISQSGRISNVPLLLIDDEADNASIDTKAAKRMGMSEEDIKEQDPSRVNGWIRKILNCFSQSVYVGYTATPFANIFIYPDDGSRDGSEYGEDLYPRSFIVNLHAPSNYIGPEKVFGLDDDRTSGTTEQEPLPLIRLISDYEKIFPVKHKSTLKVHEIPDSMKQAIYAFILSCAIRDARGQGHKHKSMLIHVTRYVDVQEQLVSIIDSLIRNIKAELDMKTGPQYEKLIRSLKTLWDTDFVETTRRVKDAIDDNEIIPLTWDEIEPLLFSSASKIEVKAVNGRAADGGLDYDSHNKGMSVIAVGGDKLSRGLTLEGLSVSYYTRISKMYDTLLQMGRWFGFRNGYADVCRLYTSRVLTKWYRHIALVNKEFRQELDDMASIGASPENYGLKVRTHPDGMIVTALNKMRNSDTRKVTYSGHLVQITKYYRKSDVNQRNVDFLSTWAASLGKPGMNGRGAPGSYIWKNVSSARIMDFLENIKVHPECSYASSHILIQYILSQNAEKELTDWTVVLISVKDPSSYQHSLMIGGLPVNVSWRRNASHDEFEDENIVSLVNNNLITPSHQSIDLDDRQYQEALRETREEFSQNGHGPKAKEPQEPSGPVIRRIRDSRKGLLLVYVFKSGEVSETKKPIKIYPDTYVGYAISFPDSPTATQVEYKVDEVYRENIARDEGEDDGTY